MVRVVPAELHVGPARPLLQPGLRHFQWALLVSERLLQRLNQHLCLEDLLQGLCDETRRMQNEVPAKESIAKSWQYSSCVSFIKKKGGQLARKVFFRVQEELLTREGK